MSTLPPKCKVIALPVRSKRNMDGVRLGHDFGLWCVEMFVGEKFIRRQSARDKAEAEAEVERLVGEGLRRLPPSPFLPQEPRK